MLLVGAGHAHLLVLLEARRLLRAGCKPTLVEPGLSWYSGLATGMLGGAYGHDEDVVDPAPLAAARGVRFVRGRLAGLDAAARVATLDDGATLPYDVLSLNLGSEVATGAIEGAGRAFAVKPIATLWALRRWVEERRGPDGTAGARRVTVVGGGATGCEVAANVAVLGGVAVRLVSSGERLLPAAPAGAARAVAAALAERGVECLTSTRVRAVEADAVLTDDGRRLGTDAVVLATGLVPPRVNAALGLPLAGDGGLLVDATLASTGSPRVFGAGDCIHLDGHDLPRLGVYGVREAPVLLHNLVATLEGRPLRRYRPQRRALSILNLGRGEALALRGRWWWRGRLAMRLKDRLDRRFLERFR